jgi:hypothetical protein
MARQPALKPRSIGVLIFEDFQLLDAAGPIGAFEMPMRGMQPPPQGFKFPPRLHCFLQNLIGWLFSLCRATTR